MYAFIKAFVNVGSSPPQRWRINPPKGRQAGPPETRRINPPEIRRASLEVKTVNLPPTR
jgi:hypothetical protein